MELDPSGIDRTSDETTHWSDDHAQNLVQVRRYRCTFCKRGFSNAQALGGHMNIHRKDRAKLREFSSENLLSLDISKSTNSNEDRPPPDSSASEKLSTENENSNDIAHDQGHDDDDDVPLVNEALIPLFSEAPSMKSDHAEASVGHFDKRVEGIKADQSSCGGALDLELRLGPEPQSGKSKSA